MQDVGIRELRPVGSQLREASLDLDLHHCDSVQKAFEEFQPSWCVSFAKEIFFKAKFATKENQKLKVKIKNC